jgi:hypothetical protein
MTFVIIMMTYVAILCQENNDGSGRAPSPSPLPLGERDRVRAFLPKLEMLTAAGDVIDKPESHRLSFLRFFEKSKISDYTD